MSVADDERIPLSIQCAVYASGTMGMSQPLMISILSRATVRESQGKSVGLRATANRLTATVLPVVMGGIVEFAGLEARFLIIGAVLMALMAILAVHVKRTPALSDSLAV